MVTVHFLHVSPGACSIIEHDSRRITMIDVCNGRDPSSQECAQGRGTFPSESDLVVVNPIQYLHDLNIKRIFRFVATHPDMDHLDGIKDVFENFSVRNFWDTDNDKEDTDFKEGKYREEDWDFYRKLRSETSNYNHTRLVLYPDTKGCYYNEPDEQGKGHDSLYIYAPTKDLIKAANESKDKDYNDASYVLLHKTEGRKILFCGDSNDKTWNYILDEHCDEVKNVDLMIAPHHGRHSDRKYDFLEVTNPKLSLFGCVEKDKRADSNWKNKSGDLEFIAVDEVGSVTVTIDRSKMKVYVANKEAARKKNGDSGHDKKLDACFYCDIPSS